jgi:plasmid stabilization system protein ParE
VEVIILRKAEDDLWSAWEHYEQIQPGLGDGFEAEVQRALVQIADYPESAPLYASEFRRVLVRRSKHGIFNAVLRRNSDVRLCLGLLAHDLETNSAITPIW